MRWLITGAGGMLGSDLCSELSQLDETAIALAHGDLDITDSRLVLSRVEQEQPEIIVNCAGYTRVDQAESDESMANALNGSAVEILAAAANEVDALLIQVSSDFVFDGSARRPYDVTDRTAPLSVYGRSKLLGEIAATHARRHLIIRTSWLFGRKGPNFVEAIRKQMANGASPIRVVDDQRGRPTYTPHLARAIIRLGKLDARGLFHYADAEECSWYEFATAIAEESGSDATIRPVSTDEFPRPAKRPVYSVLSTERYERVTGAQPASWREGLREYLTGDGVRPQDSS